MEKIRNADKKFVCRADAATKTVEIIIKGCKTLVRFTAGGRVIVINTKLTT